MVEVSFPSSVNIRRASASREGTNILNQRIYSDFFVLSVVFVNFALKVIRKIFSNLLLYFLVFPGLLKFQVVQVSSFSSSSSLSSLFHLAQDQFLFLLSSSQVRLVVLVYSVLSSSSSLCPNFKDELSKSAQKFSYPGELQNCMHKTYKVGTHDGTSPCNKSQGQVPLCVLTYSLYK